MLANTDIIAFVPTRDFDRAKAFYEGMLGLRLVKNDGFALVFDAHGIMLRVAKVAAFTPFPFTILGWNVRDVEQVVLAMQRRGVILERYPFMPQEGLPIWSAPSGDRVAWFKDPDGNTLSVSQHV
jgi:catechol 2,3-dioxygenase-like lactoylglutathione lyase family enzyme